MKIPVKICPDCGAVVAASDEMHKRRRLWECCNPKCGLQFIVRNHKIEKIRYAPWGDLQKEITSLYILRRFDLAGYDECRGFVVRATSPQEARRIAVTHAGREDGSWLVAAYSTCEKLSHYGPSEVILRDFRNG